MTVAAHNILREYAADRWPTLNHKGRISRLAGTLRWGFRRVRSLYNNEQGVRVRADEMAALEGLKLTPLQEANIHDFQALQDRVARLEALLAERVEGPHRAPMDQ